MSKLEEKVARLLSEGGLNFKREVSFSDLKSLKGGKLRFDFVVYNPNGTIGFFIEVDGRQHFQWTPHFQKTIFDFKKTQEWDRTKNAYCLKKKIPLIRIPYWEIENLTLRRILTNPDYRVVSKFHNDILIRNGVMK